MNQVVLAVTESNDAILEVWLYSEDSLEDSARSGLGELLVELEAPDVIYMAVNPQILTRTKPVESNSSNGSEEVVGRPTQDRRSGREQERLVNLNTDPQLDELINDLIVRHQYLIIGGPRDEWNLSAVDPTQRIVEARLRIR